MMFKTHLVFGFLIGLLALGFFNPANQILFITIVVLASALPDIDHPDSNIGKKVKIISILFRHRGFFHSILATALFTLGLHQLFHNTIITTAFLTGYASHIIIDALTHQGIMPFHPLTSFKIKGFMKSNGIIEYVLFAVLIVAAGWILIGL